MMNEVLRVPRWDVAVISKKLQCQLTKMENTKISSMRWPKAGKTGNSGSLLSYTICLVQFCVGLEVDGGSS